MDQGNRGLVAQRSYPIARKSMPFLRGPPVGFDVPNTNSKTLVARQAAELIQKDRIIKDLRARLAEADSYVDATNETNQILESKLEMLGSKFEELEKELGAQNRAVDFLRDQVSTYQEKLFELQFKEPDAAPQRHPAFTRIQGKTEVQWLLQLRAQGWYELEDLATTFAGEDRLGEGFTPKDYTAIIQSVNPETVTVQFSKNTPMRTFYFESPKSFVPSLPLYYKGRAVGVLDERGHVDKLMVLEGI
ncbi:hypothetical protein BP6252_05225 [Coleophoma cylindrospora]|uniref:Uncharacterized protein n=1 Tax=Coleophoma cylindrospora TaxID=1849047 RepID=A0A3D8RSV2_9HELO|nr:hypothetical protein BP6252_05225 [Coleophoma cylindrospora]